MGREAHRQAPGRSVGARGQVAAWLLAASLIAACRPAPSPTAPAPRPSARLAPSPTPSRSSQAAPAAPPSVPLPPAPSATPTPGATVPPGRYDLYVRRLQFGPYPPGEGPRAGEPVPFIFMIATDKHHPAGPYFPASHVRWRQGAGFEWHELACPADGHYAYCLRRVELWYAAPGRYEVAVEADSRGEVAEVDETNNRRTWRLSVAPAAAPGPEDLQGP